MDKLFTQGSSWRKWDLHIHTPASVLNNEFGGDWDVYVKALFTALIEKDIAAVGITDYFTINGYKKIREEYLSNQAKLESLFSAEQIAKIKNILVLPNIEFRSNIFVGSNSVNFHVILSDTIPVKDIEEKFLHEIDFIYEGEPQSADRHRKLKENNLIELGEQLKAEHATFTQPPLFVGMMNAVVDDEQVSYILSQKDSTFGGKYLFVVMADEDLSLIGWNSRDHLTRKVLIQKSDMLFSSNAKTRAWALGKAPYLEGVEKFISEFKTVKPCIHGSDAHGLAFIGHPCAKRGESAHNCATQPNGCDLRFCWIKADPTFEGLKQILYEPDDRVVIQTDSPTPLKSSQSLDGFEITAATVEPELKFADTSVPINHSLVAVTGGKGSGKTALVDLIANIYENRAFCDDKNSFVKRISEGRSPAALHTKVILQNGEEHAKEIKDESYIEGASIVYVAQGELEKHVEDPAHLETYINNLIFDSNEIKDSELLFDYQNINDDVASLNERLRQANTIIFGLETETDLQIEDNLNKTSKKLNTELVDVEKKIVELAKGLSAETVKKAELQQKELAALRDKKTQLNDLGIAIRDTLKFVDEDLVSANKLISRVNALAASLKVPESYAAFDYPDTDKLRNLIGTVRDELRKTIGDIEKFQKELEDKERGIKEHATLLDQKKELEKSIQQTKDKLKMIADKKNTLEGEVKKRAGLFEELLNKRVEQRNKYLNIIVAFSANKNDILNDLEFTAELVFDNDRFVETMSEVVDLRKIKITGATASDSDIAFFTEAMLDLSTLPSPERVHSIATTGIQELLSKIVPNQKRAETISRHTIYDSIFADYLGVMPSVKYKKVKLSKLSLGQKATVLLKIYLAQGESPIVIDSHDDHLDNEFIMDELVKALRQAKQHRQIIIVSNNGNVVVNSDAEQVIIANRDDQGLISYQSGALENPELRAKLLAVLEGGEEAFSKRQRKYRLNS
jgi:energy-coupling factor transporter ATP-binding protein EcfA2